MRSMIVGAGLALAGALVLTASPPAAAQELQQGKPIRLIVNDGSIAEPRYALSPCHFLTTASMRKLGEIYPEGRFDPTRFRPNLVLDCGAASGFIEQGWLGKRLIGPAVELTVPLPVATTMSP